MFEKGAKPPTKGSMAVLFCKLSVPAILTSFLMFSEVVVNTVFAARMNDATQLAAVGLSAVYIEVMILSIMIGLNAG